MAGIFNVLPKLRFKGKTSQFASQNEADFWTKLSINYDYISGKDYMSVMAALRCGMVIAQGLGQMPLKVKRTTRKDTGVFCEDAFELREWKLLNRRPNDWMTSIELREMMALHAVFTGSGRALVVRGVDGRPLEIIPLHPSWCEGYYDQSSHTYVYNVSVSEFGMIGQYTRDDIIEISSPRWNYYGGLDVTKRASKALGLALNLESRQSKLTERNAPYGIIAAENNQSKESINNLKKAWQKQFGEGRGIGVVDFAAKFQQMAGTAQEQQTIENRKFQIEEVARAYGVFPQMLMHGESMNFASVEAFFLAHWTHTIHPWAERLEQAIDRTLFDERPELSAKLDERGLVRTSLQGRAEYLARALGAGGNKPWITQNEAREMEGINPHPQGFELDIAESDEPSKGDDT